MAYQQPRYTVLERRGNLEVRRYEPYIVAEIEVRGSLEDAGNKAFRPLADFIFGKNRRSETMGMTAPVTQAAKGETIGMTAPVIQSATGEQAYVVSFVMPSRYTMATLPQPIDPNIRFRDVPASTVVAWTYRGTWSESRYRKEERALREALAKQGWTVSRPPVWARYNPPFWPWFLRRNEILAEFSAAKPAER